MCPNGSKVFLNKFELILNGSKRVQMGLHGSKLVRKDSNGATRSKWGTNRVQTGPNEFKWSYIGTQMMCPDVFRWGNVEISEFFCYSFFLREINFREFRSCNTSLLCHFGLLNFMKSKQRLQSRFNRKIKSISQNFVKTQE